MVKSAGLKAETDWLIIAAQNQKLPTRNINKWQTLEKMD